MTRSLLVAALLASAALSAPAHADDPRLVSRLYDPTQVVRIEGKVNVQATIRFGEDESIENVAIGDSQKWQVTPNRRANLLFLKPMSERAATNMTVVTNKRVYLFDLVASPAVRHPLYVLSFDYPVDLEVEAEEAARLAAQETPREGANATEMAAAGDDYAVVDPATLNFEWVREGSAGLLPERVYDNGDATFLAWPVGAPMPAILIKDEDGTEGPVNYAVRGDTIVIDLVPGEIILRAGDDAARLVNNGPSRVRSVPQSALAGA